MEKPYYAVIFTSTKSAETAGYDEMAQLMVDLAKQQNGFLGVESARNEIGITVSYWQDLQSIRDWKQNIDHQRAQLFGIQKWYSNYKVRIALVEREYSFE